METVALANCETGSLRSGPSPFVVWFELVSRLPDGQCILWYLLSAQYQGIRAAHALLRLLILVLFE
jgi:hypothetical protein